MYIYSHSFYKCKLKKEAIAISFQMSRQISTSNRADGIIVHKQNLQFKEGCLTVIKPLPMMHVSTTGTLENILQIINASEPRAIIRWKMVIEEACLYYCN